MVSRLNARSTPFINSSGFPHIPLLCYRYFLLHFLFRQSDFPHPVPELLSPRRSEWFPDFPGWNSCPIQSFLSSYSDCPEIPGSLFFQNIAILCYFFCRLIRCILHKHLCPCKIYQIVDCQKCHEKYWQNKAASTVIDPLSFS